MDTIDSSKVLSDCVTSISLSKSGSPWIVIKTKGLDGNDTHIKAISVKLCDDELHSIYDWIEDYFKAKDEQLQKQKDHNRKIFEDGLIHIETDEPSVSSSVTIFIAEIADYFDFTHSPRAVATLRNSVQVCWENDDVMLIVEFLYIPQSTPLIIWEIKDKDGQYCGEGRIDTNSNYIEQINNLVDIFYHPPTAEA